jgi:hypothetical protein
MKYLIWATNNNRFRTKTSWINNVSELFENEKMLSFNSREDADKVIKCGFLNCQSYGINKTHPLYKHC